MKEIWKDIPEFEGIYQVSNLGRIKGLERFVNSKNGGKRPLKEQIIQANIDKEYFRVSLWKNQKVKRIAVHILVALAFIENPKNKLQVNHKNGIKTDNNVSNLEWVTLSENMIHAYKNRLLVRKGEKHTQNKLTEKDVFEIRDLLDKGYNQSEIAKRFGVIRQTISCIKTKKSWSHV